MQKPTPIFDVLHKYYIYIYIYIYIYETLIITKESFIYIFFKKLNNNFKKVNTKSIFNEKVNMVKRGTCGLWVTNNKMENKFLFHFIQYM